MRDVEEIRSELEQIASLPALARRRESIEDLAANLDTEEAHLWSKVDLYAAFGPDSIEVPAQRDLTSKAGWIELARNMLIMTPLLITWFGISMASKAYGEMLADDPTAGQQPFIALWEAGFGGRTSVTLFRVAIADVVAFMCVIGVSLWLSWVRRKIDVTVEAEERVTWNRLRQALLEASLHLNTKAFDTPARFNEELTRVAQNLGEVSGQIDQTAMRAESAIEDISSNIAGLDGAMTVFASGIAEQQSLFGELSTRIDVVASGLGDLSDRLHMLGSELQSAVSEQRSLTTTVATSLTEVARAGSSMAAANTTSAGAASQFLSGIQVQGDRQAEMVAAWTAATTAAAEAADAMAGAGARIEEAHAVVEHQSGQSMSLLSATSGDIRASLGQAANALQDSAAEIQRTVAAFHSEFSAAEQSIQAVSNAIPAALNAASDRLAGSSDTLANQSVSAQAETRGAVEASARQMEQLTAGLQSTVTAIAADVRHASEGMSVAVDRLTETIRHLESALSTNGSAPRQG